MTDNTTAVACINKQGSTKSNACNDITRDIWEFARECQWWLTAAHCPGVDNVEANAASRQFSDQTEWTLSQDIFNVICDMFGTPNIDLFASRLNKKVKRYCALDPDPEAVFIDSFLLDWGGGGGTRFGVRFPSV